MKKDLMEKTIIRIKSKISIDDNGCWNWCGFISKSGYGCINHHYSQRAHRVSYFAFIGPIPNGFVIDHLCKNKKCVNPHHLEAVTQRENVMRSNNPASKNASKTHCKNGHEFTKENTYFSKTKGREGERNCIACIIQRKSITEVYNGFKTHCKNGHEFTKENTKIRFDKNKNIIGRKCRACDIESTKKSRAKKQIKALQNQTPE